MRRRRRRRRLIRRRMKLDTLLLKRSLKALAMLVCVLGFAWLVHKQVKKFIHKKTAVAVTYTRSRWHEVSGLVFLCPQNFCAQIFKVSFIFYFKS